jgi:hypothetical protein
VDSDERQQWWRLIALPPGHESQPSPQAGLRLGAPDPRGLAAELGARARAQLRVRQRLRLPGLRLEPDLRGRRQAQQAEAPPGPERLREAEGRWLAALQRQCHAHPRIPCQFRPSVREEGTAPTIDRCTITTTTTIIIIIIIIIHPQPISFTLLFDWDQPPNVYVTPRSQVFIECLLFFFPPSQPAYLLKFVKLP